MYYAEIDYRNRVVRFQFPNMLEREWEGHGSRPIGQILSHLKANKMISKGYSYHFLIVNDLVKEVPFIDSVSNSE